MGSLRDAATMRMEDNNMIYPKKIPAKICPSVAFLSILCIYAALTLCTLCTGTQDSSDPARSYCVSSGYTYRTSPGINGGQGICMFPDNSWCDLNEFYKGDCGPSLSPNIFPEYAVQTASVGSASAQDICQRSGGSMKSVHTPWGDILMCVFPDGTTCDSRALSEGRCGADYWTIYAQSWLNAP
jgi:putative hemolysin